MQKWHPSSYVNEALELAREPLVDFIVSTLSGEDKNWLNIYVINKLNEQDVFDYKLHKIKDKNYKEYFDVRLCFKIFQKNWNDCLIKHMILGYEFNFGNFINVINTNWAHRKSEDKFKDTCRSVYILLSLHDLMKSIDENTANKIDKLKKLLLSDKENKKIALLKIQNNFSAKMPTVDNKILVDFLKKEVVDSCLSVIETRSDIEAGDKNNIISRLNNTRRLLDNCKTTSDVVNFYWNCLNDPDGVVSYTLLSRYGFTTFEDIRLEFIDKCGKGVK